MCFKDIVKWDGYKYEIVTQRLPWQQAENYCVNRGGHLASITSQAEHDFLLSFTSEEYTGERYQSNCVRVCTAN